LRKRTYILFVARDADGELRKVNIPLHYAYVFMVGALIGMLMVTGMAGSYTRMLMKVTRFNQLRSETAALRNRYTRLEQVAREKDLQVASLGSLANEVSALYGLKSDPVLKKLTADESDADVEWSLDQLSALRRTALSGAATLGVSMNLTHPTMEDWARLAQVPTLWPVEGPITAAFGERIDPFNGEGAFHRGVDISSEYGSRIVAPAEGVVTFASAYAGYGRMIEIDHGRGILTRYGHLSSWAVTAGQHVQRGQVIGYVGSSGRSTGPHLHYEVWLHDVPVNPYKYLRVSTTTALAGGS